MTVYHQTIARYAAAIGSLDAEAFANCFAEGAELHDPVGAPAYHGREGARGLFNSIAPLVRTIRMDTGTIRLNGQTAAFTWSMEATGQRGQVATVEGIDVFEFNEAGEIVRSSGFWDPGPFVGALLG